MNFNKLFPLFSSWQQAWQFKIIMVILRSVLNTKLINEFN